METARYDCTHFNGYKPCSFKRLCKNCPHYQKRGSEILLINLGALGDVARTTALLPAIKRQFPDSQITWLTSPLGAQILENIPLIHETIPLTWENFEILKLRRFDVIMNVDKEKITGTLVKAMSCSDKRGFGIGERGEIVYLNPGAQENYVFGLDDRSKFFLTNKTELQVLCETMELDFRRDKYQLTLSSSEINESQKHRDFITQKLGVTKLIGFNTGCSNLYPYKKLTVQDAIHLVSCLLQHSQKICAGVVLLGGKEDQERNAQIAAAFSPSERLFNSPCDGGIRAGMTWVNCVDTVVSGDSFGMHLAIGLQKSTIAWFGLSVPTEIEFFENGEAVIAQVPCGPCWRKSCNKPIKCYEQVPLNELAAKTIKWTTSHA